MGKATCRKAFTLSVTSDMPLDEAIYLPALDKIFAVRGQWIYRLNAATGAKEAESRFAKAVSARSSICIVGANVYVSAWDALGINYTSGFPAPYSDVFLINGSTLVATDTTLIFNNQIGPNFPAGASRIVGGGGLVWGAFSGSNNGIFAASPLVPGSLVRATQWDNTRSSPIAADVTYDANHVGVWSADPQKQDVAFWQLTPGMTRMADSPALPVFPVGICYAANANKAYAVDLTGTLSRFVGTDIAGGVLNRTAINTGVAGATPLRIRYNSVDGLVYIPNWEDDSVTVFDPLTETVKSVKSGFTAPWDVVFTASKKWAVQNSSAGLKEIV